MEFSKKTKQIGYLTAIMISVGSTIGAGIFFKNTAIFNNAGGSLGFMIASWLVAGIGILALGLALVEMTSASKKDGGVLEWVKVFAGQKFAKYSATYMIFVYLPLNFFALPIYSIMSLQDSIGDAYSFSGWEVAGLSFCVFLWFGIIGYFSIKSAKNLQWIFTIAKFIPLIIIPILSLVQIGDSGVQTNIEASATGLTGLSPWLGIMASIPPILFAMDGFYTVTSLKSDLKDEKKLGRIVFVTVVAIIVTYLLFAILLGLSGSKDFYNIDIINNNDWLIITVNVLIIMAVFGVINGFAMMSPRVYNEVFNDTELFTIKTIKKIFKTADVKLASYISFMFFTVIYFIVLSPVGIYCWTSTAYSYSPTSSNLYELTDLVTNFTSLMIFIFIGISIIGCLVNRKTQKVAVVKNKYFVPAAWVSIVFLSVGTIYMMVAQVVDMTGFNGANQLTEITKFTILLITTTLPMISIWTGNISNKSKTK